MPSPTEITVAQLARLVGLPGAPVLADVRTDQEFESDPRLIPTAQRHRLLNALRRKAAERLTAEMTLTTPAMLISLLTGSMDGAARDGHSALHNPYRR